ncbi:MAG TPA: hypothetical protein VJ904_02445 [Tichowtungia sp.]|nr:hypothetical protein [Tichowtungia sp.]
MKKKWKKRLIAFVLITTAVIAFVEFEKWMKRRAEPCVNGICPLPGDHRLHIDPFPEEIVPAGTTTNELPTPASGRPSDGGE